MKASSVRRLFINSSVVLFSLFVGVALCELSLRLLNIFPVSWPPQFQKYYKPFIDAYNFANEHGYYQPQSVIPIYADGAVAFGRADNLGYLGSGTPVPMQNDLLIFGDSFAYGYGVPTGKSFAALLNAYNAGVWAQTFPFHCGIFRRVVPVVKPKRAIWVLYPPHIISCGHGWTTRRAFDPVRHPVYASLIDLFNKTRFSTLVLKTTGWGYNRKDYYSLEWSLYNAADSLPDSGYAAFENAVIEIVKMAKEMHVEVIPLFVPSKVQVALELEHSRPLLYARDRLDANLAIDRMARILENHGIGKAEQINLMELFRRVPEKWRSYYFKDDAHFNERGTSAVAAFLAIRLDGIPVGEKR